MKKPFSCTQCASKFANPVDLRIHKNQDQNEKPFSCSQCDSKSANPADLEYMKISTKLKNHSAALHATPNLRILLIRRYMREKE